MERNIDGDGDGQLDNDIGAFEAPRLVVFVVNSERDAIDLNPGDGVVNTGIEGEVTLRAAVMEAAAGIQRARISLPAGTYELDLGRVVEESQDEDLVRGMTWMSMATSTCKELVLA